MHGASMVLRRCLKRANRDWVMCLTSPKEMTSEWPGLAVASRTDSWLMHSMHCLKTTFRQLLVRMSTAWVST